MNCAHCGQKPKNRCHREGFDCTGGKLDLSGYSLEENRAFHNLLGHDLIFQKYCEAPVTVLVVKDRVLGNNPMGVAYGSYWRNKLTGP